MKDGFIRIAAATPLIRVADCPQNAQNIIALSLEAAREGASLVVFPELCVSAYTCGDLFLQSLLLRSAEEAVLNIALETKNADIFVAAGFPLAVDGLLYNCAAAIYHGQVLGIVPKQNLPNYSEFYEMRHFRPGPAFRTISFGGRPTPFGHQLLFCCRTLPELKIGIEICEDLWVPVPPSSLLAAAGASVLLNLSASDEIIGKADFRRLLITSQSARLIAAYVYSDAGQGESTTDMVFAGHNVIAENGTLLSESPRFTTGLTFADVDLQRLMSERRRTTTFRPSHEDLNTVWFDLPLRALDLRRPFPPHPFVPDDAGRLEERCEEILTLQAAGLATRLRHSGAKTAVVGLSGGLDSTLALIVTAHAFDMLGLGHEKIIAVTMPCFGTTSRTLENARALSAAYGATLKEISITKSVLQHFSDIGHMTEDTDVTYENAQARERTQVLMDIANQSHGLVVGTGDLSELALGWATYNGDHMSMYTVNASVPKTLIRHLTRYEADRSPASLSEVLLDVLNTPVSPELLPQLNDSIVQKTEDIIGPYELHDFFLYYMLRFGYPPKKLFRIACIAFDGMYGRAVIKKWLKTFISRFFSQQFKRSCLPDGPKVGSVTLSPRGDFRMPSDACADRWLCEIDSIDL